MFSGFLPTARPASFMFDFVSLAMLAVTPILAYSIYIVKRHRNYRRHKQLQVGLTTVLAVAVLLFEIDIRLDRSWWERATQSPFYRNGILGPFLWFHLAIAVSTTALWAITFVKAVRGFSAPPAPGPHSSAHRAWAKYAAFGMYATAVTGWTFYWMAFVAG